MKKSLLFLLFVVSFLPAISQTTYLQLNQEDYQTLDRLETRTGILSDQLFLSIKPVSRKNAVSFLEETRDKADSLHFSDIDRYKIDHAISVSGEWAEDEEGTIEAKTPWFKTFYKKQPDFLNIKTKDFFMVLNPVVSGQVMTENYKTGNTSINRTLMSSSRGAELRGWVMKKVGFYTYFTDNQEQPVTYVNNWINQHNAVPGADYYQTPSHKTYDYILARGYLDFAVVKDHVNVTFGYDKFFNGDGMNSLFLSDFSSSATFLRINTRVGKLNYQNLYLELTPQYIRGTDRILPHKYATMHHLSMNVTRWLNLGLFESVIFGRENHFEFSYMNPIILYRSIERANGSPDNANLGLNFKAIAARHLQFYGQIFFDEFKGKELFSGDGWHGNKFGVQLGGKYFDAFTVKNLDLQGELNIVRPFTYSHYDSISNYSNYNQPLAHPLESSFAQLIGVARYQPVKNLYLTAKGIYYLKGADTGNLNYGNTLFKNYDTRAMDYGNTLINGAKTTCWLLSFNASYELRENFFIDMGATHRKYTAENNALPGTSTTYAYFGIRLNIAKRDYDWF